MKKAYNKLIDNIFSRRFLHTFIVGGCLGVTIIIGVLFLTGNLPWMRAAGLGTGAPDINAGYFDGYQSSYFGALSENESVSGDWTFSGTTTFSADIKLGADADLERSSCPTGYILVPGSSTFGTKDFCVMKYEAKQDATTKQPSSVAAGSPWVSLSWYEAKNACKRAGAHLITEAEWMTIARNIESTTINDMDDDASLQLATGHSDNVAAAAQVSASGADPVVSGCSLTSTMENAANVYSAASCEIRGDGSYGGDTNDKGFYLTGQAWATTGYSAGLANKSQLRTHILSNGEVIWDFAGNVWEWTDMQCDTTTWHNGAAWEEWNDADLTDYEQAAGGSTSNTSANGAGQFYGCSANGNAALRGGSWGTGVGAGVFTLYLSDAPSLVSTNLGCRCARQSCRTLVIWKNVSKFINF